MKAPKQYYLTVLFFLLTITQNSIAQIYPRGLDINDSSYERVPKKAQLTRSLDTLPSQVSLRSYAPYPKSQGQFNTCTAWACAYCAQTMIDAIKNSWTDKDSITAKAYSPGFLFRLINPNDNVCSGQTDMELALQTMKSKGCLHYSDLPDQCAPSLTTDQIVKAAGYKITDYARLFDVKSPGNIKIQAIKRALAEKKPVVIGMLCPPSFNHAYHDWQPSEQTASDKDGHAMCVVGYDDNQYGGAFEVQNSWGDFWGFEGYTWIHYNDFARFVKYAYEFIDLPDVKPEIADLSGSIKLILSTGEEMNAKLLGPNQKLMVGAANTGPPPITVYQTTNSYLSGTKFRICISNNEPAYVYAISSDLTNQVTKIFPYKDGISAALTYKKNDVIYPDDGHYIQFDNTPGTDFLCVLYSRVELDINNIIVKISAEQGSFNEKVLKVAGGRLLDPANIKFTDGKIAFRGFSNGKDTVALLVEMDHK
jgi:hypothetical protein